MTPENFQGTNNIGGTSRGHLCDSSAFLFFVVLPWQNEVYIIVNSEHVSCYADFCFMVCTMGHCFRGPQVFLLFLGPKVYTLTAAYFCRPNEHLPSKIWPQKQRTTRSNPVHRFSPNGRLPLRGRHIVGLTTNENYATFSRQSNSVFSCRLTCWNKRFSVDQPSPL